MGPLVAAAPVAGAAQIVLGGGVRERAIGPFLVAAGLAILAIDLLIGLRLRGLLRPALASAAVLLAVGTAHAQLPSPPWRAALDTRLAYVMSGDPAVDGTARAGLAGLSAYVNSRTAAHLGDPSGVQPGTDDLSFYPLLYWPVAQGQVLSAASITALNDFTRSGGIIFIDSRGDPAALKAAATGLAIPPLTPLTTEHVLARAFYLLSEYPGARQRRHGLGAAPGRPQQRRREPRGDRRQRLGLRLGRGCVRPQHGGGGWRAAAAHPRLPVRREPGDVRADR